MAVVAGVDGCRVGWVMLARDLDGGMLEMAVAASFAALELRRLAKPAVIAIDMPIGLSEQGPRGCDGAARRLLPGRASSVFPPPPRAMLDFEDYAQANAWGKARGRGLQKQTWNIFPRMRDLDRTLTPADQDRVFEAHPELAFARLNGGKPPAPKRLSAGLARRKALLAKAGVRGLDRLLVRRPSGVAPDDLLDAAVLTLTAERILSREAVCLPERPDRDRRGLRMEIWY